MTATRMVCPSVNQIRHVYQSIKSGMSISPFNQASPSVHHIRHVCQSIKSACPSVHQFSHVCRSIKLGMSFSPSDYVCLYVHQNRHVHQIRHVCQSGKAQSRPILKIPSRSRPVPSRGINGTGRDRDAAAIRKHGLFKMLIAMQQWKCKECQVIY